MPSLPRSRNSGSVGEGTGWTPLPIIVEEDGQAVAAAPAYLKTHSQGEYVFDHGWADGFERAGGQYYPKLQIAVPFTPVPGGGCSASRPQHCLRRRKPWSCRTDCPRRTPPSSPRTKWPSSSQRGWLIRTGIQYHWRNRDYAGFDDFLARADQPQAQGGPQGARGGARRASSLSRCAAPRSARRTGTRCGISIRTPAPANGATLI